MQQRRYSDRYRQVEQVCADTTGQAVAGKLPIKLGQIFFLFKEGPRRHTHRACDRNDSNCILMKFILRFQSHNTRFWRHLKFLPPNLPDIAS